MQISSQGTQTIRLGKKSKTLSDPRKGAAVNKSIENFVDGFNDRMRNPLSFAFAFSWCAYNWQVILLCFADDLTSAQKTDQVSTLLAKPASVGYPAFAAFAYVLVMPLLLVGVNAVRRFFENWDKRLARKNDLGDATDRRLIADEELARARAEAETDELEGRKAIDTKLSELETKMEKASGEWVNRVRRELKDEVDKLLAKIASQRVEPEDIGRGDPATENDVPQRLMSQFKIDALQATELITVGILKPEHVATMTPDQRQELTNNIGANVVDRIENAARAIMKARQGQSMWDDEHTD